MLRRVIAMCPPVLLAHGSFPQLTKISALKTVIADIETA
jgi:hypothetical protein